MWLNYVHVLSQFVVVAIQDVGFTGNLDNALKFVIKNKAKCIDEVQEVEAVKTGLDRIRDAVVQERSEAVAEATVTSSLVDGDQQGSMEAAEDEVIRMANPAKYAEHGAEYWQAFAAQMVKTYINLIPEPRTQQGVADAISNSEVNKCKGQEQKSAVLVLLDVDLLCESMTRPSDRRPVLPEGVVHRLLRGSMQGRGAQKNRDGEFCQPVAGDVYFILDGKREYLHKLMLDAFSKVQPVSVRVFNLFLSEQSLRARKTIVRGSDPISQTMRMLAVSLEPLVPDTIPEKAHSKYHGTNRGDVIGLINVPPLEGSWQMAFEKKKLLYGDRIVSGDTQDKDARSQRRDDNLEPCFYNHMQDTFYQNLFVTMSSVGIVDLSAGPGEAAKAALLARRPYLGLCLTESHVAFLYRHLVHWALDEMGSEGSPLFNAKYAARKAAATGGQAPPPVADDGARKVPETEKQKKMKVNQKKKRNQDTSGDETSEKPPPKKHKRGKNARKISSSESDSRSP